MAFPDGIADFRSDTVSRPTAEMRAAMAAAEVGDDVYGEDPTVNALEEECAAALGKEAGLFVPSGTMGNQIALNLLSRPGDEVLCVDWAHVRNYEAGAASAWSGVAFRNVATAGGEITKADVEAAVAGAEYHLPSVRVMVWENTHNVSGGTVVPVELMEDTSVAARAARLGIHIDGARLWNAVAASGDDGARFAAVADTVTFCFSKGLGAPVGSMLCADEARIREARVVRQRLGGAMRQVGVIAAAARVGFAGRERLADDHATARRLADAIRARYPDAVPAGAPETNMVVVDTAATPWDDAVIVAHLAERGVWVGLIQPGVLRFVTHHDVDAADVDRVAAADRRVGTYSGGMRRRLDLALSLIHEPSVLFLDEPTTGLDPMSRISLWEEIRRLNDDGTTVLLTTQYLEEADQLAERIAIIDEGVIVRKGRPAELKAEVGCPTLFVEIDDSAGDIARATLATFGELRPSRDGAIGVGLTAGAGAVSTVIRQLDEAGVAVRNLELHEPSLDDVFAEATGHRLEGAE